MRPAALLRPAFGLALVLLATPSFAAPADRVVYANDFERAVDRNWSLPISDLTPTGSNRFLGQYANDTVRLTLGKLPTHRSMTVTFDLLVIRTWDGNNGDTFSVSLADGRTLLRTTFSNMDEFGQRQAYPDPAPGGDHPARTGAHERNTLGFLHGHKECDAVYRLSYTFDHLDPVLEMDFRGSGLQELADESWGLDNVRVIVREMPLEVAEDTGRVLAFDGRDDFLIVAPSPSLDLRGDLTVEARVRIDGDTDGQILWRGDARVEHDPYALHLHEGKMEFRVDTDFRGKHRLNRVRSKKPLDRKWHLWTGVCDRRVGLLYLYRDGRLEAREEIVGEITYDTSKMWNTIGAVDRGNGQRFKGEMDEIRTWSTVRTPIEIVDHRDRRLTGREDGLAAGWRFDRVLGQIVPDLTPHGHHAVLGTTRRPEPSDPKPVTASEP